MTAFLHPHADGVALSVRLQPRASKNQIDEPVGSELKIRVTAPPVDAAANQALLRLLSDVLDCPRHSIELLRGQTSRHKVILIRGLPLAFVEEKLLGRK
ncbi:MAG: DUF167 domain-containing protein [Verrucomicrobia bacterium]|nr:DUF167 domain-containing protein [Verrucomicrobiota bacterium]